jgi:hypothetical protein
MIRLLIVSVVSLDGYLSTRITTEDWYTIPIVNVFFSAIFFFESNLKPLTEA